MKETVDYLTALVRCAITGERADFISEADTLFDPIVKLARFHDIAHLAALAMIKSDLLADPGHIKTAEKLIYDASYRDAKNNYTYELAERILSEAKIPYMPLKGVIIKPLYPENWMRSSCDVDILVHKSDFDKAVELFKDNGFVLDGDLNFHDVSLLYDDSNLELHFNICENYKKIDGMLSKVWDYAEKKGEFKYLQTNDYFVFHHIAHMSYHFLAGGCGIRTFLDLWIMNNRGFYSDEAVSKLCEMSGILEFYNSVKQVMGVWFDRKEHTEMTLRIQKYILTGGTYGYFPNNAAAYTVMRGGKVRYLFSLAFPKFVNMKVIYPQLNRAPFLLPFFYVYRVFQKTLGRNSESAKRNFKTIKGQGDDFIKEVASLIKSLQLDK